MARRVAAALASIFARQARTASTAAAASQLRADVAYCADLVRRVDYENYLWAVQLPKTDRAAALALRAYGAETATIQDAVKEPALAAARFVWWREAGVGVGAGAPPAHPVPRALAAAVSAAAAAGAPHPTPTALRYRLGRLADARAGLAAAASGAPSFRSLDDAEGYAADTGGSLSALQLAFSLDPSALSGPAAADADHATSHAGTGAGLAALLRGLPHAAARRRCVLPAEVMEEAGLRAADLFCLAAAVLGGDGASSSPSSPPPDPAVVASLRDATYRVACVAAGHLDAAARLAVPRAALPALLPAVGARRYLAALEAAAFDPLALVHRAGGRGVGGGLGLHIATKWALVRGRVA